MSSTKARQSACARTLGLMMSVVGVLRVRPVLCLAVVLCCLSVGSNPSEPSRHQTAAAVHGQSVLFFATHLGSLRGREYDPIVLDQVLVNVGAGYDVTTGVFTAPVSGVYQFVFAAQLCRGDYNNVWEFRLKGGKTGMVCHAQVYGGTTTLNTCYYMVELKKGDQVSMWQRAESCAWADSRSKTINFSGVLLSSHGASMLGSSSCPLTFMRARVSDGSTGLSPAPGLALALLLVYPLMI